MVRLRVRVADSTVHIGPRFALTLYRTLRIPDDGRTYPLPPGLGPFPVLKVADYRERVPVTWKKDGGVFIPMYQREALWLGFEAAAWKPNAVQVGVGRVNAVSGEAWGAGLGAAPQNYLVCPNQPWLDGINAGAGFIRQFVAMPLGSGLTVEEQVRGTEEFGGIQILVYEPRPGRFPARPPPEPDEESLEGMVPPAGVPVEMGLGAGGKIRQKIYPDPYGLAIWEAEPRGRLTVHIVNSEQFHALTGRPIPPTPVSPRLYAEHGLPWFDLYDASEGDVPAPAALKAVAAVKAEDVETGASLDLSKSPVHKLRRKGHRKGTEDRGGTPGAERKTGDRGTPAS